MKEAIEAEGLTRRYGKLKALRGVDFTMSEGSVYRLVGPNGVGKTTLIRALVGTLRPSDGEVWALGLNLLKDRRSAGGESGTCPNRRRSTRTCRPGTTSSSLAPPITPAGLLEVG